MVGVLVYVVIGFVLFTPIGVISGYLQHKNKVKGPDDFTSGDSTNHNSTE